ncbi:hypothetical protein [Gorillibacterium sp. sgz5001074]|uniref:hypothetical protein n=1 Tax=Gorillibacterium sp. sgz5001074 TaxID=3446695 RepID=UPI003F680ADC
MIAILYDELTRRHMGFFPDYTPETVLHCPFVLVEDVAEIPQELLQSKVNSYYILEVDGDKLVGFTEITLPPPPADPTADERISQLEAENATLKTQVNELTVLVGDLILMGGVSG